MASSLDDLFGATAARPDGSEVLAALTKAARERILILDGAMGTQIQGLGFHEEHFRGDRFAACDCQLQGNNDLLTLTQPKAIEEIHYAYAMAGADILETNTFSSTTIAQADYGMEGQVYELNRDGARLAVARRSAPSRRTVDAVSSQARWGRPTARLHCRRMSTIRAFAPSLSTICASPMPNRFEV